MDRLKDALPSGGYLVMYEGVDTDPAQDEALGQYNESGAVRYRVRRPEQVIRFFDGLEVADPGVVPIHQWRPDPGTANPPPRPRWAESEKAVSRLLQPHRPARPHSGQAAVRPRGTRHSARRSPARQRRWTACGRNQIPCERSKPIGCRVLGYYRRPSSGQRVVG